MKTLTIGQIARRSGVGVATVRFYEKQGLIEEPPRTAAGYRQYPEEVVSRLRFIQRAKDLGFSLKEVDELTSLRLDPATSSADVKTQAEAKIADIDAKIRDLKRMRKSLLELTQACNGQGTTRECPILEALNTDQES